jgi:hypothetical protein
LRDGGDACKVVDGAGSSRPWEGVSRRERESEWEKKEREKKRKGRWGSRVEVPSVAVR